MPKANPLGDLEYTIIHQDVARGSQGDDDVQFEDLATEKAMTGPETYSLDAGQSAPYHENFKKKAGLSPSTSPVGTAVPAGADNTGKS